MGIGEFKCSYLRLLAGSLQLLYDFSRDGGYSRLPLVRVHLTSAMGKILNANGDTTFLYDRSKSVPHLDVSFHDEVSWSGERR